VRIIVFVISLLLSGICHAVDAYQWCQVQIDNLRELTTYPIENLNSYKRSLANASTVEELDELTGKEYSKMILMLQQHQNVGREEAEKKTLEVIKSMEIKTLSMAIQFHGLSDEQTWSLLFDKCVQENQ